METDTLREVPVCEGERRAGTAALRTELVADGLMRVAEAAEFLGLSRAGVYQLMGRGELPFVKIGRARRVPRRAVLRLASEALHGGGALSGPRRDRDEGPSRNPGNLR
jgi:excisionase family DNA binding protein